MRRVLARIFRRQSAPEPQPTRHNPKPGPAERARLKALERETTAKLRKQLGLS